MIQAHDMNPEHAARVIQAADHLRDAQRRYLEFRTEAHGREVGRCARWYDLLRENPQMTLLDAIELTDTPEVT